MSEPVGCSDDERVEGVAAIQTDRVGVAGGVVRTGAEVGRPAFLGAGRASRSSSTSSASVRPAPAVKPLSPPSASSPVGAAMRVTEFDALTQLAAQRVDDRLACSISFCTKGVGTDSRANPSVMTSGLTSFNQALC